MYVRRIGQVVLDVGVFKYEIIARYVNAVDHFASRNDHTTMTAPLPVCSAKLSIVGPG